MGIVTFELHLTYSANLAPMPFRKVEFTNKNGFQLDARLDLPLRRAPYPFAIFAHVFTGNKNLTGSRHISKALNAKGIAVLRFDFTGLGESEGDFSDTNFSSNVDDIIAAADFLTEHYSSPQLIIGQSLGGAAAIFAATQIESITAVATIGTPSYPDHVTHLLASSMEEIETTGRAVVNLAGRQFCIKKQFLDDLRNQDMGKIVKNLNKAIMIMHSPQDQTVKINNAANIYNKAKHPKSFVTLDGADHLLTKKEDAYYSGTVIGSWAERYIDMPIQEKLSSSKDVVARLEDDGFTTEILAGQHSLIADEPEHFGGNNFGPSPYQLLCSSLGACTAMTIQMYARRKKWQIDEVKVHLKYERDYEADCENCEDEGAKIDHYYREIELIGDLTEEQRSRCLQIADKCPVHKTLSSAGKIVTKLIQ